MTDDYIERCINQVFRPKYHPLIEYHRPEGHGDCSVCTPDYKNKECLGFYPVRLYIFNAGGDACKNES